MTLGFVCETYHPYSTGGAEESIESLALSLIEKGVRIILVAPNFGSSAIQQKGIDLRLFPVPFRPKKRSAIPPIFFTTILFQLYSAFWIWRICRSEDVDLLHVQGKYMVSATMIARLLLRKPVIVTVRDYIPLCPYGLCLFECDQVADLWKFLTGEIPQYLRLYARTPQEKIVAVLGGIRGWFVSTTIRFFLRKADRVVFLSKLHRSIYRHRGIDGDVIGNIVDGTAKRDQSGTQKQHIVFIGRLTFGKGADIVLDAFQKIRTKYPQAILTFVGNGSQRSTLEAQVKSERLEKCVSFTGFVEYHEVDRILKSATVVVLPGRWPEPFGRVAAEALLSGIPVVASRRGGWTSFIDQRKTGLLVNPSVDAVTEAIEEILKKEALFRDHIFRKQKEYQHQFGSMVTNAYIDLYKKMVRSEK